jgi:hypothetical protein
MHAGDKKKSKVKKDKALADARADAQARRDYYSSSQNQHGSSSRR